MKKSIFVFSIFFLTTYILFLTTSSVVSAQTTITLNPTVTFQTFNHWEGVDYAKDGTYENTTPTECYQRLYYKANLAMPNYINDLLDESVDLGINRVRLEINSG